MEYSYVLHRFPDSKGDFEIHKLQWGNTCLPRIENRFDLGRHNSDISAQIMAERMFGGIFSGKTDGCYYCCPDIHTS